MVSRGLWSVKKVRGSQQRFVVSEDGEGKGVVSRGLICSQ